MKQLSTICLLFLFTTCGQENKTSDKNIIEIEESAGIVTSIIKLIATPDKFHDRVVTVTGFMNVEFEGNGIYIHQDDYENGLYSNGLWINLTDAQKKGIDSLSLNKKYVLIDGTFNASGHGHVSSPKVRPFES